MKICKKCLIEFKPKNVCKKNDFCSLPCYWESMKKTQVSICLTCGIEKKSWRKYKYCSIKCRNKSDEWRENQGMAKRGIEAWNKGKPNTWTKLGFNLSEEAKRKISMAKIGKPSLKKGKPQLSTRGKNNWNWKGSTGTERHQAMGKIEYKLWRAEVFERDNYICMECGAKGTYLHADHIKDWSLFPKLRYDINNGQTLCTSCHYLKTFGKEKPNDIKWGIFKEVDINVS